MASSRTASGATRREGWVLGVLCAIIDADAEAIQTCVERCE